MTKKTAPQYQQRVETDVDEQPRLKLKAEVPQKCETTQQVSSKLATLKPPEILMRNDALTVTNCATRYAHCPSASPSPTLMVTLFEYEMRLQQARASADLDRQIAEAHIASERYKFEQERSRADIAVMKLRMFQINL